MFVCSVLGWFFVVQDLLVGNMYNAEGVLIEEYLTIFL